MWVPCPGRRARKVGVWVPRTGARSRSGRSGLHPGVPQQGEACEAGLHPPVCFAPSVRVETMAVVSIPRRQPRPASSQTSLSPTPNRISSGEETSVNTDRVEGPSCRGPRVIWGLSLSLAVTPKFLLLLSSVLDPSHSLRPGPSALVWGEARGRDRPGVRGNGRTPHTSAAALSTVISEEHHGEACDPVRPHLVPAGGK